MSIKENLNSLKQSLPEKVTLVAVSKTKPESMIQEAYDAGQRIFGENKALELAEKHGNLPKDIEWHFIGHLQRNKVKAIAPFVKLIHAVDSLRLLKEIDKQAKNNNRIIDCLLQFHIASEESKFGFDLNECVEMLRSDDFKSLENIRIVGVMGMATNTSNDNLIKSEFSNLKQYFDHLKSNIFNNDHFCIKSMGMSNDYQIAIELGSTMIRVGSAIFGSRS